LEGVDLTNSTRLAKFGINPSIVALHSMHHHHHHDDAYSFSLAASSNGSPLGALVWFRSCCSTFA
jgi:hypothetical protein